MSYWIPQQRMTNELVLPPSAVAWNEPATLDETREGLARLLRDGRARSARVLGKLLRTLAGASARVARALERVADRLHGDREAALLPAELLVELDVDAQPIARRPPPIPVEALPPRLLDAPVLASSLASN